MSGTESARHACDVASLMAGLLLAALAGLFFVSDLTDLSVAVRWVGPVLLIGVGAVGLLTTIRSRPGADPTAAEPTAADLTEPT